MAEVPEIDEETLDLMKEAYSIFDRKGDNKVEAERLGDVLRALNLNPTSGEIDKLIETSNLTGQRVDFETFYGIYHQVAKSKTFKATYEEMLEAFKTYDRDQSGNITSAELRHIMIYVADKMEESQVDVIVGPHENAEGLVHYQDVLKTIYPQTPDSKPS